MKRRNLETMELRKKNLKVLPLCEKNSVSCGIIHGKNIFENIVKITHIQLKNVEIKTNFRRKFFSELGKMISGVGKIFDNENFYQFACEKRNNMKKI
jgi:hypothetical protein